MQNFTGLTVTKNRDLGPMAVLILPKVSISLEPGPSHVDVSYFLPSLRSSRERN